MDCPEIDFDNDDICDDCRFKAYVAAAIDDIEDAVLSALDTPALRKHEHRMANHYLRHALVGLDELWNDLIGDDDDA